MAIVKIISNGKNNAATKQILSYVLNPNKTTEEICGTIGDYTVDSLTPKSIFRDFQRIKSLFGKQAGGRTYTHGTVSFPPEEKITYEQAADFAREYLPQVFPGHQILYATHTDTDHVHFHFVVNPVSYLDGSMLHWKKYDLQRAKELCNTMCQERGLSIAKKGHHHDGTPFDDGEITSWDRKKYQEIIKNSKESYLVDAFLAIQYTLPHVTSREEFCSGLEEYGWRCVWEDKRKHITFINKNGEKVRDSNISKTFHVTINKEMILNECKRNLSEAAGSEGAYSGAIETDDAAASCGGRRIEAGEHSPESGNRNSEGREGNSITTNIPAPSGNLEKRSGRGR